MAAVVTDGTTESSTTGAFGRAAGCLVVGGVRIDRLADRVGGTPFFAYDRRLLSARVERLRAALPAGMELSYAIKANPMPAVAQHLSRIVDSFDVASAMEMRTALDTGLGAERVSFAGPGKTPAELTQAVAAGVTIEMESATELRRVTEIGDRLGIQPIVAVRVNPDFAIKGSGMRLGGGAQQFGVDSERVPALLTDIAATGVRFLGFHIFAASQVLSADILCAAQRSTVDLALQLAAASPLPVTYLNLGGGFGIPYSARDRPLDLAAVGDNLHTLLHSRIRPALGAVRVITELGRYVVGECGVYVTRVVDRKESRGSTFLVVDGGLHHQLAASGHLGQVIRRNYPLAIGNRLDQEPTESVSVVGCLCTPLDLLGDNVRVPHAEIGDLVAIFQAGAYGLTASPTAFLSHSPPVEVLV